MLKPTNLHGLWAAVLLAVVGIAVTLTLPAQAQDPPGTVWAWGYNDQKQLGDGTYTSRSSPVQVLNLTGAVAVAAGGRHSLALKADCTVWGWGDNQYGQLGNGTTGRRSPLVQVLNLADVTGIGTGLDHSLALKSDGTARA